MCTSLNEILEVFKDKYYYEMRSHLEKSKTEPPENQFQSNYAARELLDEMKYLIQERIDDCGCDKYSREVSMLAAILYLHGCISMDVDEKSIAEETLDKSIELIKDEPLNADHILSYISCYNQLGLLWCERGQYTKALKFLRESEEHYLSYDHTKKPTDFEKLLTGVDGKENGKIALERVHTLTLYYLAQALGSSGDSMSAAAYCHKTLKRQLDFPDLDKADWALNAATLSQVLVEKNAFKEARNHLAAASRLLEMLQADLDQSPDPETERHKAELEILSEREAEVCRCWAKYCLNLLTISKDRLMDESSQPTPPPGDLCGLEFENLVPQREDSVVSYNFALTWEDALALYRRGCAWLDHASQHYTLENHATDHVSIVRDKSELYMALAFFCDDISKQCKMHKRRLDSLKEISDQLNPTYYMDLLRQIWFEMGQIYITMIDLKSDRTFSDRNDYTSKINYLVKQGIVIFQKFVDSFGEPKNSERYEEGYERSILLSKIHIAKLLMKIKTDDSQQVIQYNTDAYRNYKDVVDYCDKWKRSEALSEGEVILCREMTTLLPLKLSKLLRD